MLDSTPALGSGGYQPEDGALSHFSSHKNPDKKKKFNHGSVIAFNLQRNLCL